jgi:glutamate-1-semialdehyde 2,1-aminomutase
MYFGAAPLTDLTPAQIRAVQPALVNGLRGGLLARGVDLMSHTSCVTSAAHTPALIDEALGAFDDTLTDLVRDGVIAA